jgi:hypothetical protein
VANDRSSTSNRIVRANKNKMSPFWSLLQQNALVLENGPLVFHPLSAEIRQLFD